MYYRATAVEPSTPPPPHLFHSTSTPHSMITLFSQYLSSYLFQSNNNGAWLNEWFRCDYSVISSSAPNNVDFCAWISYLYFILIVVAILVVLGMVLTLFLGIFYVMRRVCGLCGSAKAAHKNYSSQLVMVVIYTILATFIVVASLGGMVFTITYGVGSGHVISTTFNTISMTIDQFTTSAKDITGGTGIVKVFAQNINQLFKDNIYPLLNSTMNVNIAMMQLPISLLQSQLSDLNSIVLKLQQLNELEQEIMTSNKDILDTLNYPFQSLNSSSSQLQVAKFPQQSFQSMNESFYSTLYPNIMNQIGNEMMNQIIPIADGYVSVLSNFNSTDSMFTLLQRNLEMVIGNGILKRGASIFEGVRLSVIGIGFLFILSTFVIFMSLIYRRNPRAAKCSSCCSCILVFWMFLFGAANVCVFMILVPYCREGQDIFDPQRLPSQLHNTTFSIGLNITKSLLKCQGEETWIQVVQEVVVVSLKNGHGNNNQTLLLMESLNQYVNQLFGVFQTITNSSSMIPIMNVTSDAFKNALSPLGNDILKKGIEQPMKDISNLFSKQVLDDLKDISTYSSQFKMNTFQNLIQQLNSITKNITIPNDQRLEFYYDTWNISTFNPNQYPFNISEQYSELIYVYENQHLSSNTTLYQRLTLIQSQLILYTNTMMNLTLETPNTLFSYTWNTLSNTLNGMNQVISMFDRMNEAWMYLNDEGRNISLHRVKSSIQQFVQYLKSVFLQAQCGFIGSNMKSIHYHTCQVMNVGTIGMGACAILIGLSLLVLYPIGLIASKRLDGRSYQPLLWRKSKNVRDMDIKLLEERANELTQMDVSSSSGGGGIGGSGMGGGIGGGMSSGGGGGHSDTYSRGTGGLSRSGSKVTSRGASSSSTTLIKGSKQQRYAYSGVGEGDSDDSSGEDDVVETVRRGSKRF
ncbi:hypothetical protein C9374_007358 [Naegleria lovaniensis]|uniref:Prominin n=1 Tax=Naegleria lovaniensis TaxID=51637 RepID=A0AA88GKK2_NAELO|nr:uncharacterized protein C9374_007358 [Naegleria lovaniensis]KAG2379219.1 hypothetical protein C9374_007358 [Naegleria lovaniensis]